MRASCPVMPRPSQTEESMPQEPCPQVHSAQGAEGEDQGKSARTPLSLSKQERIKEDPLAMWWSGRAVLQALNLRASTVSVQHSRYSVRQKGRGRTAFTKDQSLGQNTETHFI